MHSSSLTTIVEVLNLCNLADSRFNYSETQLNYWAAEIQNDYPNISLETFTKIIRKGIKGGFEMKSNHITLSVIFDWVKRSISPSVKKSDVVLSSDIFKVKGFGIKE